MKFRTTLAALATATALMAGAAQAAVVQIVGGDFGAIPGNPGGPGSSTNQALGPLGLGASLDGYDRAMIQLPWAAKVTFTYFGSEATFTNTLTTGFGSLSNSLHPSNNFFNAAGIATIVGDMLAGVADFSFDSDGGPGPNFSVVNGANTNMFKSFFASVVGDPTSRSGSSVYLFFDDGGAGPNDNHDDLVVRMDVAPIPLPAAGFMLIAGLGGLAALKRRHKSA